MWVPGPPGRPWFGTGAVRRRRRAAPRPAGRGCAGPSARDSSWTRSTWGRWWRASPQAGVTRAWRRMRTGSHPAWTRAHHSADSSRHQCDAESPSGRSVGTAPQAIHPSRSRKAARAPALGPKPAPTGADSTGARPGAGPSSRSPRSSGTPVTARGSHTASTPDTTSMVVSGSVRSGGGPPTSPGSSRKATTGACGAAAGHRVEQVAGPGPHGPAGDGDGQLGGDALGGQGPRQGDRAGRAAP